MVKAPGGYFSNKEIEQVDLPKILYSTLMMIKNNSGGVFCGSNMSNTFLHLSVGHRETQACPVFPYTWRVLCWSLSPSRWHWRHL